MRPRAPKRVFILGGGAGLGAPPGGGRKELQEQGIRPDGIVGSSIGVINAAVYASAGVEGLERAWTSLRMGLTSFRPSLRHNPVSGFSFFTLEPLASAVERFMDFEAIHASPVELCFILLNLSRGEGQFVTNRQARSAQDLRKLVRAGYSIPILFPPVRHRGEWYVDGGFAWNVPILQAVEMGATEIYVLAVVATELPFQRSFRGFLPYLSRLADVMWRTLANVGFVTTRIEPDGTYRGVPVTVIQPTEEHAGFGILSLLSSSPAKARRLITAGYRDAKRELARQTRARASAGRPVEELPEVEPAFRNEVA